MSNLSWEQKIEALQALSKCVLHMQTPGKWLARIKGAEIGGNGVLSNPPGVGCTPEEAVNDLWRQLVTELPANLCIVTDAWGEGRKQWRWNGFMWREVPIERAA